MSILRLEVMACSILQNDKIQAIEIKKEDVKFSLFANDMLTLIGMIQIVKSFAIPKFMSNAFPIYVSDNLLKIADKEFF